jgi:hypothetical protein
VEGDHQVLASTALGDVAVLAEAIALEARIHKVRGH